MTDAPAKRIHLHGIGTEGARNSTITNGLDSNKIMWQRLMATDSNVTDDGEHFT